MESAYLECMLALSCLVKNVRMDDSRPVVRVQYRTQHPAQRNSNFQRRQGRSMCMRGLCYEFKISKRQSAIMYNTINRGVRGILPVFIDSSGDSCHKLDRVGTDTGFRPDNLIDFGVLAWVEREG